jgi:hypothetical protein
MPSNRKDDPKPEPEARGKLQKFFEKFSKAVNPPAPTKTAGDDGTGFKKRSMSDQLHDKVEKLQGKAEEVINRFRKR